MSRSTPFEDRLFGRMVEDDRGCWLWQGMQNGTGYGLIKFGGRRHAVHRVAYEFLVAEIPDSLFLDHLCRVRHCANPYHVEPVTNAENLIRGEGGPARNRRKTHCLRGHALSGDNLLVSGERICRTCKRRRESDRRAAA